MSTVHSSVKKKAFVQYTKGAPDVVLDHCTKAYIDGKKVDMSEDVRKNILALNKEMADKGASCAFVLQ